MLGAGAIATALGVYHFASDRGLLGIFQSPKLANVVETIESELGNQNGAQNGATWAGNNSFDNSAVAPSGKFASTNYSDQRISVDPSRSSTWGTSSNQPQQPQQPPQQAWGNGTIQVFFSPAGGCTDAIVREIQSSQRQILIQAYSFTSEPIARACVEARGRGVSVFAILDRSQETEQYSAADFLLNSGIPTLIDSKHQIAHNKVILIDGQTVITGSFNFTNNAERSNAENLLIIRGHPDLYSAYEQNYRHHYEHAEPFHGHTASHSNHGSGNTR